MAKPETTFTASVHRLLPPLSALYREKMANPYRGGTPDYWYSNKRDLWIEWKFIKLPAREQTEIDPTKLLSALQQKWLYDRFREGRNVWVIIGCKVGGVVLRDLQWTRPLKGQEFRDHLLSRLDIALRIRRFIMESA